MHSPEQIAQTAKNKYPHFLREHFAGRSIFPYEIPFGRPRGGNRLVEVAAEARALVDGSAAGIGYGYTVETEIIGTRFGEQRFPTRVYFPDAPNFLRFVGKEQEFADINEDIALIEQRTPAAALWARANPLRVHPKHGAWSDLCAIMNELTARPRPGCFPRELPLSVSGKLLEQENRVLCEILQTIPGDHWKEGADYFEQLGLRRPPAAFVRIRFLDPQVQHGNRFPRDEIALSNDDLARTPLQVQRVFIVENLMTYLAFPPIQGAIAIFGEGKAGERVSRLSWLANRELWYWGDIDSHGLEILRVLRGTFPGLRSVFMDEDTLERFAHLISKGTPTLALQLTGLQPGEAVAAERVFRKKELLEQEKIPQAFVVETLEGFGLVGDVRRRVLT